MDQQCKSDSKKQYSKPILTTQKMELGVFGNYGDGGGGADNDPRPYRRFRRIGLRME